MGKKQYILTKHRYHPERADSLNRLHLAEPAPLGLFGLSMGCLLLIAVDFEQTSGALTLIPWIILLPGALQVIAGIFDFLRHNIFGGTAFLGYGVFWLGLGTVYILETYNSQLALSKNADKSALASSLLPANPTLRQHTGVICWGYLFFSILLTFVAAGINRILFYILFFIDFGFLFLCLHIFLETPAFLVAIFLIGVFFASMYGFFCILLLKVAGGEVLPVGRPFINWSDHIIVDKRVVYRGSGQLDSNLSIGIIGSDMGSRIAVMDDDDEEVEEEDAGRGRGREEKYEADEETVDTMIKQSNRSLAAISFMSAQSQSSNMNLNMSEQSQSQSGSASIIHNAGGGGGGSTLTKRKKLKASKSATGGYVQMQQPVKRAK